MFSLIETAHAMAPASGAGGGDASAFAQFIPLILIFAIFWFLVIRPQQKRAKQHREMVAGIKKGDEVYTDSGIFGTIQKVTDDSVTLEIAPKVSIRLMRSRVAELAKASNVGTGKEPAKGKDKSDDAE